MIELNEAQCEDIRDGIEKELSALLGYSMPVQIDMTTNELRFVVRDLPIKRRQEFNDICFRHKHRVSKVRYDSPPE